MSFGKNLVALRESRGVSRKELAESLGIPYTTLRNYETDQREPGHKLLVDIAQTFSVSVDELVGNRANKNSAPAFSAEALDVASRYEAASPDIKAAVRAVLSVVPAQPTTDFPRRQTKKVFLFGQSFAAGSPESPGDRLYEEYETDDLRADFAIHVNGDSMEPYLHDGSIALGVNRRPKDGEVGAFFLDGGFLVKQCCVDNFNNVYLFSLNRRRKDADETVWRSAGRDLRVIGTILMDKRIPLPED